MTSRALSLARAVALGGSGLALAAACAADEPDQPEPLPVPAVAADASAEDASTEGSCASLVTTVIGLEQPCAAGKTCFVDEPTETAVCGEVDGGILHPCGVITCGSFCACSDKLASRCSCFTGIGGPLPPPEVDLLHDEAATARPRRPTAPHVRRAPRLAYVPRRAHEPSSPAVRTAPATIARARAAARWEAQMLAEHRSIAVFRALARDVAEASVLPAAARLVLRMADDERRHAATCADVARALGGAPRLPARDPRGPVRLARHPGCSPDERALRNVVYATCLSETIAAARLTLALERTEDDLLRRVTRSILADEVVHARFGFDYLDAARPWLESHPEARASLSAYLRRAFAVLEAALAGPTGGPPPDTEERALGLASSAASHALFHDVMEHAIVPGLEAAGLDAGLAWRARV